WGPRMIESKPWRAFVRTPAWKGITATRSWRVALNARELAYGRDLLRENRRLAREGQELSLDRLQAEYVIKAFVERHDHDAELPPPELRLRVGSTDDEFEFLAKGVRASGIVVENF